MMSKISARTSIESRHSEDTARHRRHRRERRKRSGQGDWRLSVDHNARLLANTIDKHPDGVAPASGP
jgi:hypothetical protein